MGTDTPTVTVVGTDPNNAAQPAGPAAAPAAPLPSVPTPTQQATTNATTTFTDPRGRSIVTQRITIIQRTRLFKMIGPANAQNVPLLGYYSFAASVRQIDAEPVPFPTSEAQVEAMLDRLGDDGIEALAQAWKDAGWANDDEGDPAPIKN